MLIQVRIVRNRSTTTVLHNYSSQAFGYNLDITSVSNIKAELQDDAGRVTAGRLGK